MDPHGVLPQGLQEQQQPQNDFSNTLNVNINTNAGFGRFHSKNKNSPPAYPLSQSGLQIPGSAAIHGTQRFHQNLPSMNSFTGTNNKNQLNPFTGRMTSSLLPPSATSSSPPTAGAFSHNRSPAGSNNSPSPTYHHSKAIRYNNINTNTGNSGGAEKQSQQLQQSPQAQQSMQSPQFQSQSPQFQSQSPQSQQQQQISQFFQYPRPMSNQVPTKTTNNTFRSSSQGLNEEELAQLKKKLKNSATFASAVLQISKILEKHLSMQNKQKFYGALVSVSHCVGVPGFTAKDAKPLFEVALGSKCKAKWSSGYLANITEWNGIIDQMIAGTWDPSSYNKGDGRFGTPKFSSVSVTSTRAPTVPRPLQTNRTTTPTRLESRDNSAFPDLFSLLTGRADIQLIREQAMIREMLEASSDDSDEEDTRPYPFFQFTSHPELIPPTGLQHSNRPITSTLRFTILPDIANLINSEENKSSQYFIHLISFMKTSSGIVGTKSPQHLLYRVNGKQLSTSGSGKSLEFGYNITSLCVSGQNQLQITALKCCCTFQFGVRLVQNMTRNLIEDVMKSTLTREESLTAIKKSFSSQGDIVELHITLSLICPLGQMFIDTPVRGRHCKHIQCFDLETYMLMNKTDPTWSCPVCNKSAGVADLVVDQFMKEILETVGSDDVGESIKIDENGKWELFCIEFGDHSESDDEESSLLCKRPVPDDLPVAEPPTKIMRSLAPPPKPQVIDLTL